MTVSGKMVASSPFTDGLRFRDRYSQLPDDELARIALSGQLVPEAREALTAELQKRGISDLSGYKRDLEEPTRDYEIMANMQRRIAEGMAVALAWCLAIFVPFLAIAAHTAHAPVTDLLEVGGVCLLVVAFSCYLGIKARKEGSRIGYVLKLVVPLVLLGISTIVVACLSVLNVRL